MNIPYIEYLGYALRGSNAAHTPPNWQFWTLQPWEFDAFLSKSHTLSVYMVDLYTFTPKTTRNPGKFNIEWLCIDNFKWRFHASPVRGFFHTEELPPVVLIRPPRVNGPLSTRRLHYIGDGYSHWGCFQMDLVWFGYYRKWAFLRLL